MIAIKYTPKNNRLLPVILIAGIISLLASFCFYKVGFPEYDALSFCESVPTPVFSAPEGIYDQPFELEINAPEGYDIFYTTDGSIPTTSSRKYRRQIHVDPKINLNKAILYIPTTFLLKEPSWRDWQPLWKPPRGQQNHCTVIRARCFKNGAGYGKVENVIYSASNILQHHGFQVIHILIEADSLFSQEKGIYVLGDKYYSKKSRVYMEDYWDNPWGFVFYPANYSQRGKNWIRPAEFILIDSTGKSIFEQSIKLGINGFSSRVFPLKAFRIIADGNRGDTVLHYSFFDSLPYKTFKHIALRNSGDDMPMTMFKDAMVQQTVKGMNLDIQGYAPSVVYINGNYWGIHNIREKMDENYLAVKYNSPTEMIDVLISADTKFIYYSGDNQSLSSFNKLIEYIQEYSLANNEAYQHVCTQMDIDNFIDYVIVETFFANKDWINNNIKTYRIKQQTEMMKQKNIEAGKWRWLLYDLDAAYLDEQICMFERLKEEKFAQCDISIMFWGLLENPYFKKKFLTRYEYIIRNYLTSEYLIQQIEDFEKRYQSEIERHIARWRYPESIQTWRRNVEHLKEFARKRPEIVLMQLKEL